MSGTIYSKFYWSDWLSDTGLRACSYAARGLWMDMLCIAASEKGFVRINGRDATAAEIARITCGKAEDVEILLQELEFNGVFSRNKAGSIYSRKMAKSEKNRRNGLLGGNPKLLDKKENQNSLNHSPKPLNTNNHIPLSIIDNINDVSRETKPSKKSGTSDKRRTRIDKNWTPSSEVQLYCVSLIGEQGVADALPHFRDHHISRGSLMVDWGCAFQNWCRNAKKWDRGGQNNRDKTLKEKTADALQRIGSPNMREIADLWLPKLGHD